MQPGGIMRLEYLSGERFEGFSNGFPQPADVAGTAI